MKFAEFFSGKGKALKADNFCLIVRKHDEARGSLGTRQEFETDLYRFAYTCRKEVEVFFGENADIEKMRKKIIKIRKIAQKQFTKEKNTNII